MHAKYTALVPHESTQEPHQSPALTRFIALDKCVPRRQGSLGYMHIMTIDVKVEEETSMVLVRLLLQTGQLWAHSLEGKGGVDELEMVGQQLLTTVLIYSLLCCVRTLLNVREYLFSLIPR